MSDQVTTEPEPQPDTRTRVTVTREGHQLEGETLVVIEPDDDRIASFAYEDGQVVVDRGGPVALDAADVETA